MSYQKFFAVARKRDIEIDDDGPRSPDGVRHIHAWAPEGFIFSGSTCHNACCMDIDTDVPIDAAMWAGAIAELELEPCGEPLCDYCHPSEEG
mgnify:CR=1 FL=1|tara:strand:+ start:345 stop:620 length:276 start_codon:yes stop_codon:yes gene_type:complete